MYGCFWESWYVWKGRIFGVKKILQGTDRGDNECIVIEVKKKDGFCEMRSKNDNALLKIFRIAEQSRLYRSFFETGSFLYQKR